MKFLIRLLISALVFICYPRLVHAQIKVDVIEADGRYVLWKENEVYEISGNPTFIVDSDNMIVCTIQSTCNDHTVISDSSFFRGAYKASLSPGVDYTIQFYDTKEDDISRIYRIRYKPNHFFMQKLKQRPGLLSLRNKIW